ncbi:MAG: stress protein [Chthoniobacteraceae bacterium]|nr:stress protein [Chthoniobacteraceae bacterium]
MNPPQATLSCDPRKSSRKGALVLLVAALLFTSCATGGTPRGHIQQVGLVWLKHPGDAPEREKIIAAAQAFARDIPDVESVAVGPPTIEPASKFSDQSFDVCFIVRFRDEAARQRYNTHPAHQKAAQEVFLPLSRKLLFYRFVTE